MNWSPIAPNDALHSTVNDMLEILFQNIGFIKLILDGYMRAHQTKYSTEQIPKAIRNVGQVQIHWDICVGGSGWLMTLNFDHRIV